MSMKKLFALLLALALLLCGAAAAEESYFDVPDTLRYQGGVVTRGSLRKTAALSGGQLDLAYAMTNAPYVRLGEETVWEVVLSGGEAPYTCMALLAYQADLTMIQNTFMSIVKEIKKELGSNLPNQKAPLRAVIDKIYAELPKDQNGKMQKPTAESVTQATGIAIQKLTGMQPKNQEALSAIFLDIFTAEYEKTLEDAHEQ